MYTIQTVVYTRPVTIVENYNKGLQISKTVLLKTCTRAYVKKKQN